MISAMRMLALVGAALAAFMSPSLTLAATSDLFKDTSQPILIRSNSIEVLGSSNIIVFRGDVTAKGSGFEMQCREMMVHYTQEASKGLEKSNPEGAIERIVALGPVRVVRSEGGIATAEKAEFFQREDKLVMSGKAVLTHDRDSVEGERITIYIKENRIVVDGSQEKKVKATIFPKGRKGSE
jgi:lipopolysaccharide export system protein LptA